MKRSQKTVSNIALCFVAVLILTSWCNQNQAQSIPTPVPLTPQQSAPPKTRKLDITAAKNAPPVARLSKKIKTHEKIEKALQSNTKCKFVQTPLIDVMKQLKEQHGIPIVFDEASLNSEGVDIDESINFIVDSLSLGNALSRILEPLNANYYVANECLIITSSRKERETVTTVVYDVRKLIAAGIKKRELVKAMRTIAANISGDFVGERQFGYRDQDGRISLLPGCLIIRQSYHSHKKIFDLLQQLERLVERKNIHFTKQEPKKQQ